LSFGRLSERREREALSANLPKFEASLIVRGNIKSMDELKGKRIGIQEPGGFADLLSRAVLRPAKSIRRRSISSRQRRRAGARRQPGRHGDFAHRAGDAGENQGAGPARHRAHVGLAAEDALHLPVRDREGDRRQAGLVQKVVTANIAAGVRLAIGRGLVGTVIAEFYTMISGLGL
jgi:hypothetical protein